MYDFNPNYALTAQGLNFGGGFGQGLQMPQFPTTRTQAPTPNVTAGFEFGLNAPTLNMGLGALNTVGNLWGAWQANRLAKDQLDFTKNVTNTNLNNSIQSYNTALGDRARARGFTEGRSDTEVADYVSANRLSR